MSEFISLPIGGGDVDGVHHSFDGLSDLPRSHCVLLKLCLHCRLRDELLRRSEVRGRSESQLGHNINR